MKFLATKPALVFLVFLFLILFLTQPALACTWDPIVNKCHPVNGEVVVYKHGSCSGTNYRAFNSNNQMEYNSMLNYTYNDGDGNLNDSITCVVVGRRTKFYYYQHTDFKGSSGTLFNSNYDRLVQKNFAGTWWNDTISSIKVFSY